MIVDAAIMLADAEGLDAVSIRRVATVLGVRPMSLYTYIDRKEDLLALMRDRASAAVLMGADLPAGWREALTVIARRTREVMLRHRWMSDISAHGAGPGPNALRHMEESIAALRELGLSPRAALDVLTTVDKFVLGHVIFEVGEHDARKGGLATRAYVDSLLASGEFPELAQAFPAIRAVAAEADQFERGLTWLLDGIAASIGG
jgi:AcrR family transcriptional regulator